MFLSVSYDYAFEYCSFVIGLRGICFSSKIYDVHDVCFSEQAFLHTAYKVR